MSNEPEYRLINVEERNLDAPSFEILPEETRESLAVTDFAKIGIEGGGKGERFWVQITRGLEDGLYRGVLCNQLVSFDISVGHPFLFGSEHVLDVHTKVKR